METKLPGVSPEDRVVAQDVRDAHATWRKGGLCVWAVIVTYNPNHETLVDLVRRVRGQVDAVVVVDNASTIAPVGAIGDCNVCYVQKSENEGVAAGFNSGIALACEHAATHVILFDQDSLPRGEMVKTLLAAEHRLLEMGIPVAGLGPRPIDVTTGNEGHVYGLDRFYRRQRTKPDFANVIEVSYLMSSGQLIRRDVLERVGLMLQALFIDAVDIEWSLRARARGFRSFVVVDAGILHNLGDKPVQIGSTTKHVHSPERHYYVVRNSLLLCRLKHIPIKWKIVDLLLTLRRLIAYPLLCENSYQHVKWMSRGLRDGVMGKAGRANYPAE